MASVIEFDVKSAVLSNGIFGKEQIDQIVTAIGEDFSQFSVLRDGVSELEIEEEHSPATSTRLGVCYYLLGRFDRALEELTTKSDGGAVAQFYIGRCYAAKNDHNNAIDYFQKARLASYDEDFCKLAEAEVRRLEEALEEARQALVQKIGENISVRRVVTHEADGGVIGGYVHGNNRIAVLVSLKGGSEELARDVAMHVAAVNPQVVSPDDMPEDLVAKEREIYSAQAQDSGKPPEIVEKMIDGRIRKFLSENSLTEQAFVKDPDTTVGKLVSQAGAEVIGFSRFEVGEGIEVEKVDFASEVAAQLGS